MGGQIHQQFPSQTGMDILAKKMCSQSWDLETKTSPDTSKKVAGEVFGAKNHTPNINRYLDEAEMSPFQSIQLRL